MDIRRGKQGESGDREKGRKKNFTKNVMVERRRRRSRREEAKHFRAFRSI